MYKDLVNEHIASFHCTKCKIRKSMIQNDIVRTLEKWGARFYEGPCYDSSTQQQWKELTRKEVLKKVRQALVDKKKQYIAAVNSNEEPEEGMQNSSGSLMSMPQFFSNLMQRSIQSFRELLQTGGHNDEDFSNSKQDISMDISMNSFDPMMFENNVYFTSTTLSPHDDSNDCCPTLGNKKYNHLCSSYQSKFNCAFSHRHRVMIAREIVTKLGKMGTHFYLRDSPIEGSGTNHQSPHPWQSIDTETTAQKVFQDLLKCQEKQQEGDHDHHDDGKDHCSSMVMTISSYYDGQTMKEESSGHDHSSSAINFNQHLSSSSPPPLPPMHYPFYTSGQGVVDQAYDYTTINEVNVEDHADPHHNNNYGAQHKNNDDDFHLSTLSGCSDVLSREMLSSFNSNEGDSYYSQGGFLPQTYCNKEEVTGSPTPVHAYHYNHGFHQEEKDVAQF